MEKGRNQQALTFQFGKLIFIECGLEQLRRKRVA